MRTFAKWFGAVAVGALTGIGTLGCNTVHGAGKDIEKSGQAVEKASDSAKRGIEHPRTHAITATTASGGRIDPSGSISVATGSHQTFTITASRGYHVADVLVDGKSVGAVKQYTLDNVTEHHTISASFAADPR
jgi:predicted small secreted protein